MPPHETLAAVDVRVREVRVAFKQSRPRVVVRVAHPIAPRGDAAQESEARHGGPQTPGGVTDRPGALRREQPGVADIHDQFLEGGATAQGRPEGAQLFRDVALVQRQAQTRQAPAHCGNERRDRGRRRRPLDVRPRAEVDAQGPRLLVGRQTSKVPRDDVYRLGYLFERQAAGKAHAQPQSGGPQGLVDARSFVFAQRDLPRCGAPRRAPVNCKLAGGCCVYPGRQAEGRCHAPRGATDTARTVSHTECAPGDSSRPTPTRPWTPDRRQAAPTPGFFLWGHRSSGLPPPEKEARPRRRRAGAISPCCLCETGRCKPVFGMHTGTLPGRVGGEGGGGGPLNVPKSGAKCAITE